MNLFPKHFISVMCLYPFFLCTTEDNRHFCLSFSKAVNFVCVFVSGQQHSEEFKKLSTVKKVPVMKDGSFVLTERYRLD